MIIRYCDLCLEKVPLCFLIISVEGTAGSRSSGQHLQANVCDKCADKWRERLREEMEKAARKSP